MSVVDGVLIALIFISAVLGVMVALVKTDIIALKNSTQIKVFTNLLIASLLLLLVGVTVKLLMSDEGQRWLDSFSENGDCDQVDRPYWCDL